MPRIVLNHCRFISLILMIVSLAACSSRLKYKDEKKWVADKGGVQLFSSKKSIRTLLKKNQDQKKGFKGKVIPFRAIVRVTDRGKKISQIEYKGKTGYIFTKYLSASDPGLPGKPKKGPFTDRYYVPEGIITAFEEPDHNSSTEFTLATGAKVRVIRQKDKTVRAGSFTGKWTLIKYKGNNGWVLGSLIAPDYSVPYVPKYHLVPKGGVVKVRSRPSQNDGTKFQLKPGDRVVALVRKKDTVVVGGQKGQWLKVRFRGKKGWILNSQVYPDPNQKPPPPEDDEDEDKVPAENPFENRTSVKIGFVGGLPVYHSDPKSTIANYTTVGTDWKFYINARHAFDFHAFYALPSFDSFSLTSLSNIFSADKKNESYITFPVMISYSYHWHWISNMVPVYAGAGAGTVFADNKAVSDNYGVRAFIGIAFRAGGEWTDREYFLEISMFNWIKPENVIEPIKVMVGVRF